MTYLFFTSIQMSYLFWIKIINIFTIISWDKYRRQLHIFYFTPRKKDIKKKSVHVFNTLYWRLAIWKNEVRHKSPSKKYLLHVCQLRSQLLKGKGREGGKERQRQEEKGERWRKEETEIERENQLTFWCSVSPFSLSFRKNLMDSLQGTLSHNGVLSFLRIVKTLNMYIFS